MAWGGGERDRRRERHIEMMGEERTMMKKTVHRLTQPTRPDKNHPPETMTMKKRLTICRKIIVIPVCNIRK